MAEVRIPGLFLSGLFSLALGRVLRLNRTSLRYDADLPGLTRVSGASTFTNPGTTRRRDEEPDDSYSTRRPARLPCNAYL